MTNSALPGPRIPVVDENGLINAAWYRYFVGLEKDASTAVAGAIVTNGGLSGGGVVSDGLTLSIADGGVTNAKLRDGLSTSVIGRFQGTDGPVADIQATADDRVLGRFGGELAFKDIALVPATVADADYGDIVVSAVGTVWAIDANAVSNAKFRQSAGLSVVARSAATTGNVADISGAASQFLGINAAATALAFQTMAGDATLSGPTITLATVNATVGSFGGAGKTLTATANAKGLVTFIAETAIAITASQVTDFNEAAQDAIGLMVDSSLVYVDASPLLTRAALTGDATAAQGSNALTVVKINGVSLAGLATGILKNTTATGAPSIAVAADFPTLNQNTTGSAATLTTSRNFSITGGGITAAAVGFNGAAAVVLSASVDAGHITLARMADVATATVFYRKTAGTGAPEVQTLATLKTDLGLTGTNSGDQTTIVGITGTLTQFNTALTGDDFASLGGAQTFSANQNMTASLGLGEDSPAAKLDVQQDSDANTQGIRIARSNESDAMFLYMSAGGFSGLNDSLNFHSSFAGAVVAAIDRSGNAAFSGFVRLASYTVATLPAAATAGAGGTAFVTDATATTFASTVAGGGANKVPVYSDGANWKIG